MSERVLIKDERLAKLLKVEVKGKDHKGYLKEIHAGINELFFDSSLDNNFPFVFVIS